MPKITTFPTLYDECKIISIYKLIRWEYLKPNQLKSGVVTWRRGETQTGNISITVNTSTNSPYIELNYNANKIPINYKIQLVSMPSNLGKGVVWFFVCPVTNLRCRKLYLDNKYFLHRSTIPGMYEKQTYSKNNRVLFKKYEILFSSDEVFKQIHKKHFKKYYNGNHTKRYLRLLKQINAVKGISEAELYSLK